MKKAVLALTLALGIVPGLAISQALPAPVAELIVQATTLADIEAIVAANPELTVQIVDNALSLNVITQTEANIILGNAQGVVVTNAAPPVPPAPPLPANFGFLPLGTGAVGIVGAIVASQSEDSASPN